MCSFSCIHLSSNLIVVKFSNVLFLETASIQNAKQHNSPNQGSLLKQSMVFLQIDSSSCCFFS